MNLNAAVIQYLLAKKMIKKKDADVMESELARQDIDIFTYLKDTKFVSLSDAAVVVGEFSYIPSIDLGMLTVNRDLCEQFSFPFLRKHNFVPVQKDEDVLVIATGHPFDMSLYSALHAIYPGPVEYILTPSKQIDLYINSIEAVSSTASALDVLNKEQQDNAKKADLANQEALESELGVLNAPAVRLVDSIIKEAIPARASDIHVEPYEKEVIVRYRIDGDLIDRVSFSIDSFPAVAARIKILSDINIAERRVPQDGHIRMSINGKEYDFRVSSIPTIHGEKFVIRILDKSIFALSRKELGFTPQANKMIDQIIDKPHGIVLLTGPTGCGKTTTLYAFLRELNKSSKNTITVEDPVEYSMPRVNQIQINTKANMTFANALRSILRQDPDIIMVGEIRDEETAQIAIRAAITGHLVLSTLHTNDAAGAILRLVDMGIPDYLVSDAVVGIISQRLVKKLCPVCKKKVKTTPQEMKILGLDAPTYIYKPSGCNYCNNTGYRGRTAVHEIMIMNDEMRDALISKKASLETIKALAAKNGTVSLFDAAKQLVIDGTTSIDELLRISSEDSEAQE